MNITKHKITMGAIALNLILAVVAFGQTEVRQLSLNQPIERTIKGGETHVFQFDVKAGQYARAEVEQKNIDVIVSLFAPDGKLVVEMDGKDGRLREAVSCIAETGGAYRVEIKAYRAADAAGSYTVKLAEKRRVKAKDKLRVEAEQHFNIGEKLRKRTGIVNEQTKIITVIVDKETNRTVETRVLNLQTAIKEYETALKIWRELGELYWEGITLLNIGQTLAGDKARRIEAQEFFEQALKIFQDLEDLRGQALTLNSLSNYSSANKEKAREYAEQALQI